MPSVEELQDTVEAALTFAGVDAETIERSPGATVVPAERRVDTAGRRAFDLLAELRPGRTGEAEKLDLHGTIGEGGMGVVRLGTQRTLGREVAVKTLKSEHRNDRSTLKLLREAWVTGALEHPNVVPVYDIALESDGSPMVVLKRIEGDGWASLMHDAEAVKATFGADDLLDWNLRILMQVCNAVRFAHSRGVLHRDLKPENVMIGPFGEVYLVDWGIAVSLHDDGSGRMPLASDAREMAGTPLYMAPEMLGGAENRLSERTDVYLLGAILFEIVAGEPPHGGETLMQIVASIVQSEPAIPGGVPAELARVVRRTMARDPEARFENAEQVRLALQGFLEHRDGARLAERARERLDELEALLAAHGEPPDDPESREPIYRLFGECRFGFRHALEIWPHNDEAREDLDRAVATMVRYELAQNEPEAARALLSEMRAAPAGLAERVEAARRQRQEEEALAERLRADADPSAGRRTRAFLSLVLGVLWVISPLASHVWVHALGRPADPRLGIGLGGAFLVLVTGLGIWARESIMRTRLNRLLGLGVVVAVLTPGLTNLRAVLEGEPPWVGLQHALLVWGGLTALLAGAVDKRLAIPAVAYVLGFLASVIAGADQVFLAMAASDLVLLVTAVTIWARPDEDLEAARTGVRRRRARRRAWLRARFGGGYEDAPDEHG
ncbi:MAG TPA: protein kinase [Sandaracinaceae bacterium LLY-WYZ-13_1]|nr:protein kinase [Sandaracinaceae bacterium LLY-WYZ-13_1]